ncbi:hypothetical protein BDK51DRAFT_37678 [Blyttiomyces helicus]|uniref:Uncharacterized protein n=1 Tax=Blyttiomyces helicus TaxID=388810 RepID=A0A4P9W540_9FUNG|nr:hypothetical protein BDK51DRAFT_37678 [Blyttiomyces helicus]|eukprot:RKO86423.1 hypothetical protein BDK51DRAFT_37678 [Blyttiomyces helicus]
MTLQGQGTNLLHVGRLQQLGEDVDTGSGQSILNQLGAAGALCVLDEDEEGLQAGGRGGGENGGGHWCSSITATGLPEPSAASERIPSAMNWIGGSVRKATGSKAVSQKQRDFFKRRRSGAELANQDRESALNVRKWHGRGAAFTFAVGVKASAPWRRAFDRVLASIHPLLQSIRSNLNLDAAPAPLQTGPVKTEGNSLDLMRFGGSEYAGTYKKLKTEYVSPSGTGRTPASIIKYVQTARKACMHIFLPLATSPRLIPSFARSEFPLERSTPNPHAQHTYSTPDAPSATGRDSRLAEPTVTATAPTAESPPASAWSSAGPDSDDELSKAPLSVYVKPGLTSGESVLWNAFVASPTSSRDAPSRRSPIALARESPMALARASPAAGDDPAGRPAALGTVAKEDAVWDDFLHSPSRPRPPVHARPTSRPRPPVCPPSVAGSAVEPEHSVVPSPARAASDADRSLAARVTDLEVRVGELERCGALERICETPDI